MTKLAATIVCVFALCAAVALADAATGPQGQYCGSYSFGLIKGTGHFNKDDTLELKLNAFGKDIECNKEKYSYDAASQEVRVPSAIDSNDCLGNLITSNGLSFSAKYDPSTEVVSLDLGIASIDLEQC